MCSATHCRKSGNIKTHNISILHIIQEASKCIKDWVKIKRLMSHKTKTTTAHHRRISKKLVCHEYLQLFVKL